MKLNSWKYLQRNKIERFIDRVEEVLEVCIIIFLITILIKVVVYVIH